MNALLCGHVLARAARSDLKNAKAWNILGSRRAADALVNAGNAFLIEGDLERAGGLFEEAAGAYARCGALQLELDALVRAAKCLARVCTARALQLARERVQPRFQTQNRHACSAKLFFDIAAAAPDAGKGAPAFALAAQCLRLEPHMDHVADLCDRLAQDEGGAGTCR